jgi:two-component system, cell cycle response regulator DivK
MHPAVLPCAPVDVLIADDDAQLRGSMRFFLETQGFTCAEAADGLQAVEIARQLAPRCVLLDLGMPELDGFAVARRLRTDPRTAHAHVHCLTGRTDPASRRQAEEAGCELFLTKPVDPTIVVAAVRGWTGLTKAAAEELLDWLEAHGYALAVITHEEGVGFGIRLPESFPIAARQKVDQAAIGEATLRRYPRRAVPRSVQKPVIGQLARYEGEYRPHGDIGHVSVRLSRASKLLPCALGALGLLAAFWLGIFTLLETSAVAALLVWLLAMPPEEWWLPSFPPSFQRDPEDGGGFIEFDGIVTERGRYGHEGMMRRRVEIVRVLHYEPNRAGCRP